ncbi:MAG: serine/threonine-protein kinase [Planctomycetota bacterium]
MNAKRSDDDSPSLDSVIADYIEQSEAGVVVDVEEVIRRHPQHDSELRSFFRNHRWLAGQPASSCPDLIGTTVGNYRIESEIARGGMGVVYRARQRGLDRVVALKLISNGILAGEEERVRFRIEAEATAQLNHPGIVAIHEIGTWQGHQYFSMRLVEGTTLQAWVEGGQCDPRTASHTVASIARAVGYAHRHEIVHRDLKPDNILLDPDDQPLVTDFGLAKWHRDDATVTRTGQVLGTPNYMSPEQAVGRGDSDHRTDIYSLGAILYALLTGRPPHEGPTLAEVLRSVLQDEPVEPRQLRRDLDYDLERICLKAISYEPGDRYGTADEMADDLQRYLQGDSTLASQSGLIERVAREIRRDQHQISFARWGGTLQLLGMLIFAFHALMYVLPRTEWDDLWTTDVPRGIMLLVIAFAIYRSREGAILPRTTAERPVWSIWLAYLATMGVFNVMNRLGALPPGSLFWIAAALSGFGFIAMGGHVWGGSAVIGLFFLVAAFVMVELPAHAPLILGAMWLVGLYVLGRHYRFGRNADSDTAIKSGTDRTP